MILRKYILFLVVSFVGFCLRAQNTHQLIGTAGAISNGLGLANGVDNISWTIGEVVVFNDPAADGTLPPTRFTVSQAMQSYPPFVPKDDCPTVTVKSNNITLCEGANAYGTKLSYSTVFLDLQAAKPQVKSVQWYFSSDNVNFSKIVGSTSVTDTSYQPYFPGIYKVSVKYVGVTACDADTFSKNVATVVNLSNTFLAPQISPSGSPVSLLTASASNGFNNSVPTLQWYVYVTALNKYLMIAGGSNVSQKVRYDGTYMVVATYPGGCRLSNTFDVNGYGTTIQRATDIRIEGNTIFIPDELVPENASLSVYPNPTMGQFEVRLQSSEEITSNAGLYSNTGIFLKEIVFTEGSAWSRLAKVGIDDLSAGVYFLKVNQEGKQLVQKVVVYK